MARGARCGRRRAPLRPHAGTARASGWPVELCNGDKCQPFSVGAHSRGDSVVLEMADYAATITAASRGGLAQRRLPQRRQPRSAGDPVPRRPRDVAAGARARAVAGPVGRHLDRRLRHQSAGDRAPQRRRRAGGHDHLQHRRLRPLRGNGEGRQLQPRPLRRLLRVHADRRARRGRRSAGHAARASSTPGYAARRHGSRCGAPAGRTSRPSPRTPRPTPPRRSGSRSPISTDGS